ncbi:conserved Plasmodium protein, unknown function [Plasmodium sp. gorilla clade G2]|uniref:conserved Plasmodium protein, unknown function n=1 Tax=Plasmodium sp. gorilla clade G2 TaxID=880535 RepID=UPI000D20C1EF|nr:conserved Plasmodium protein, unknown function [Plasmodium sp. gorilla clade G2]SOV14286.1 conserved Plasmodium protein, unknown function [Plasmodium sp. gorilla clade G2]
MNIFRFCLVISFLLFNKHNEIGSKLIHPPINVYYKDYSEGLNINQKDKLIDILLHNYDNESQDISSSNDNHINIMNDKEKNIQAIMKDQQMLNNKIKEELNKYIKRNKKMNVKYDHKNKDDNINSNNNDEDMNNTNTFDVNTQIEVPINLVKEPIVLIKVPTIDLFDKIRIEEDILNLMNINEKDLFN